MLKDGQAAVFRCVDMCKLQVLHFKKQLYKVRTNLRYGYKYAIRCTYVTLCDQHSMVMPW